MLIFLEEILSAQLDIQPTFVDLTISGFEYSIDDIGIVYANGSQTLTFGRDHWGVLQGGTDDFRVQLTGLSFSDLTVDRTSLGYSVSQNNPGYTFWTATSVGSTVSVTEPSTLALLGMGLLGLTLLKRKKRLRSRIFG